MDQLNFDAWSGRSVTDAGGIDLGLARQIEATVPFDQTVAAGSTLPPLWHWCAFPPTAPIAHLGADGHPRETDLLPPVPLPRRMWAGGSLTFHAPLRIGAPIERTSTIRGIVEKSIATGPMFLVTVDHRISGPDGLAVEERQDIVYLPIPDSFTPPAKREMPADTVEQIDTAETLLFRYSAITFNAHRIHYDLAYTTEVEHYPGLVVHGPLQATLLMRAAIRHGGRAPKTFEFRGIHPMFAGPQCDIAVAEDDTGALKLWTGQDGHQCMQASATWED